MTLTPDSNPLPSGTSRALAFSGVAVALTSGLLALGSVTVEWLSVVLSLAVWTIAAVILRLTAHHHAHRIFGKANLVTLMRFSVAAALAGLVPVAADIDSNAWLWTIAIASTITLCLDGLDGFLARRTGLSSGFGARFDMETDAFLALVITAFLWQSDKLGSWVLALGTMRYAFIAAAWVLPWLRAELFPSVRRKVVCVVQVGALCLMLCPWLSPMQAGMVGFVAFVCLVISFGVDVLWLYRQSHAVRAAHGPQWSQSRLLSSSSASPGRQPSSDVSA